MSALARYFHSKGCHVIGYDRTPSPLTRELEAEGIVINYSETLTEEETALTPADTIVVRTPAVPADNRQYVHFREGGFEVMKRSELLGQVTRQKKALCVAGTHGKTTTSTMLAHLLHESSVGTSAFLGGISNNYRSNLLIDHSSDFVVVEADEYDRSFHRLSPYMTVITSIDPDHLDIYGTAEAYQEGFDVYAGLVEKAVVLKWGYEVKDCRATVYRYAGEWVPEQEDGLERQDCPDRSTGSERPDFYAENVRVADGVIRYDMVTPDGVIRDVEPGVPVWVNIENSVAAASIALLCGVTPEEVRRGLKSYTGVYRRFNIHVKNAKVVYVDDYAHHPTELRASIESVRRIYPDRTFVAVFQPHLYSRTRDFMDGFADVLSTVDELILLPIYPAREKPIEGVTSEALMQEVLLRHPGCKVRVVQKAELAEVLAARVKASVTPVAVMTLGAGDIDRLVEDVREAIGG